MSKLRVCARVIPETLGLGLHRVARALIQYVPPDIEIVSSPSEADLLVVHSIGHGSMELLKDYDRDYAVIQYCLLTTEDSSYRAWYPYWKSAKVVWSYYDLADFARRAIDRGDIPAGVNSESLMPHFYHAPLGVDGDVFRPIRPTRKRFVVGTSGYIAETEGVRECYDAARRLELPMFHLGPDLKLGPGVVNAHRIGDREVSEFWSLCTFVAGLRRIEGFELPALEALASGSRPVCFDAPHYRQWFGEHAEYVPETDPDTVAQHLFELFRKPCRAVTDAERAHVLQTFNWQRIAQGFWEALR